VPLKRLSATAAAAAAEAVVIPGCLLTQHGFEQCSISFGLAVACTEAVYCDYLLTATCSSLALPAAHQCFSLLSNRVVQPCYQHYHKPAHHGTCLHVCFLRDFMEGILVGG
jgi:hypothetical protein